MLSTACGATPADQKQAMGVLTGADSPQDFNTFGPDEWINSKGVRFVAFNAATYKPSVQVRDVPQSEMNLDELAESLRAVTYHLGREYVAAEPQWDAAARVKNGEAPSGQSFDPSARERGSDVGKLQEAAVLGTDNRVAHSSAYPFSTTIAFNVDDDFNDFSDCAATLIGASTAVSAASCFRGKGSGGTWLPWQTWAPGADRDSGTLFPHGAVTGCYAVYVPVGWVTGSGGSIVENDYAALEFGEDSCGIYPGNDVGWLGFWNVTDSDISDNPNRLTSFPPDMQYPSLYTAAVSGAHIPALFAGPNSFGHLADHDSNCGSAVYGKFTPQTGSIYDYYVKGVNELWTINDWNVARRMDATFSTFITTNTSL